MAYTVKTITRAENPLHKQQRKLKYESRVCLLHTYIQVHMYYDDTTNTLI